jgi:hypothetical protein
VTLQEEVCVVKLGYRGKVLYAICNILDYIYDLSLNLINFYCFQWQGEHCKPEIAFAIAAVIEALWADFPDFGQLILGHFYRECPYLVPIFMPQVEGQSNEDYYK